MKKLPIITMWLTIILFLLTVSMFSQSRKALRRDYDNYKYEYTEDKNYVGVKDKEIGIQWYYILNEDDYTFEVMLLPPNGGYSDCELLLNVLKFTEYPRVRAWVSHDDGTFAYILWNWEYHRWYITIYYYEGDKKSKY